MWGRFEVIRREKLVAIAVVLVFIASIAYVIYTNYIISYIKTSSMEPTYNRGDLVIIRRVDPEDISIGDTIVYRSPVEPILILHRVVAIKIVNGTRYFLTKGDNPRTNPYVDPWGWISEDRVVGVLVARVPYLGMVFLLFDELGARFLLFLLGVLLILFFATGADTKTISIAPLLQYVRGRRIATAYIFCILILVLFLCTTRFFGQNVWSVNTVSKAIHVSDQGDYYLVVKLNVTSKINYMESVNRIEIHVILNGEEIGFGVWKISYPFYGTKIVSVGILLSRALGNTQNISISAYVTVYDYMTGAYRKCSCQL